MTKIHKQINEKLKKNKTNEKCKKVTIESSFMAYLKTSFKIHLTRHKSFNFKSYLQ